MESTSQPSAHSLVEASATNTPHASRLRYLWLLVPALAAVELLAFVSQRGGNATDADWSSVRAWTEARIAADDMITVAPSWASPVAYQKLGDSLVTFKRVARADEARFKRAFEVSLRGSRDASLGTWKSVEQMSSGPIAVRILENPRPVPVIDDLVRFVEPPGGAEVSKAGPRGAESCPFGQHRPIAGSLGFGAAASGARYQCPSGPFVALTVLSDLDYLPRRCIHAQPPANSPLTIRFPAVRMGASLQGHHAVSVHQERDRQGPPVTLRFFVGNDPLGVPIVHRDGDGWSRFEIPTKELSGTTIDLRVEVSTAQAGRPYCFEATTR